MEEGTLLPWAQLVPCCRERVACGLPSFYTLISIPPVCTHFSATENLTLTWCNFHLNPPAQCLLLAMSLPWAWVCQREIKGEEYGWQGREGESLDIDILCKLFSNLGAKSTPMMGRYAFYGGEALVPGTGQKRWLREEQGIEAKLATTFIP